MVSEEQRRIWAEYFESQDIPFVFFSAIEEQEKIDHDREDSEEEIEESKVDDEIVLPSNSWDIYTVDQLKLLFQTMRKDKYETIDGKTTVGMIGYPNVGKSSTINVLIADKKVSVSATPGKTKHFQTLNCGDKIVLCDCPGTN